jgi:hypothetical protein
MANEDISICTEGKEGREGRCEGERMGYGREREKGGRGDRSSPKSNPTTGLSRARRWSERKSQAPYIQHSVAWMKLYSIVSSLWWS